MDLRSVERYLDTLVVREDPVLCEMETHAHALDFPFVGPLVGQLLYVLSRSIGALRILELGSGFGYSAWWFCEAVGPDGEVHLTEKDALHADQAEDFLTRAGFADRIFIHRGEAVETLRELAGEFDIIFLDARKQEYPALLDLTLSRLRVGGYFIADNVLWGGRVAESAHPDDGETLALQEFNRKISIEPRLHTTILPLRDGVSLSLKGE